MEKNKGTLGLSKQFSSIEILARNILNRALETQETYYYKGEINAIVSEFNLAVFDFNKIAEGVGSDLRLYNVNVDVNPISYGYSWSSTVESIHKIIIQCQKAQGFLEELRTTIPITDVQKLNSLREQLGALSKALKDINFSRNLNEAIDESEKGHHLASALISSRVIDYMLDKIKGETIEEKVEFLKENGILKDRKDIEESLIKSAKLARNLNSHDIKIFPTPSESLSLLTDSITILERASKIFG